MPISIDHIIERMGGAEAAARITGVGTEAVRKWRQSRSIPSRHWPAVVAATGLTMADLMIPERPSTSRPIVSPAQANSTMQNATDIVPAGATAVLVLADGTAFWGRGFGANTNAVGPVGEVCFSTGMTGYQETLTDPSFAGQIITFTFPHIGNDGTNNADI
jgi:carbamoyl-phosphate synthase small subunit